MINGAGEELGREQDAPASGEEEAIQRIAAMFRSNLERDYPPSNRPARRSVHAKMQACVRAKFDVESDLEPELRHGLFGAPRSYPAWIRFSNGSGKIEPDTQNDAHGMAIKVLEVDG